MQVTEGFILLRFQEQVSTTHDPWDDLPGTCKALGACCNDIKTYLRPIRGVGPFSLSYFV